MIKICYGKGNEAEVSQSRGSAVRLLSLFDSLAGITSKKHHRKATINSNYSYINNSEISWPLALRCQIQHNVNEFVSVLDFLLFVGYTSTIVCNYSYIQSRFGIVFAFLKSREKAEVLGKEGRHSN